MLGKQFKWEALFHNYMSTVTGNALRLILLSLKWPCNTCWPFHFHSSHEGRYAWPKWRAGDHDPVSKRHDGENFLWLMLLAHPMYRIQICLGLALLYMPAAMLHHIWSSLPVSDPWDEVHNGEGWYLEGWVWLVCRQRASCTSTNLNGPACYTAYYRNR